MRLIWHQFAQRRQRPGRNLEKLAPAAGRQGHAASQGHRGIEDSRRLLLHWLAWLGLMCASFYAKLDRYIGYHGRNAPRHEAQDKDTAVQAEVRAGTLGDLDNKVPQPQIT